MSELGRHIVMLIGRELRSQENGGGFRVRKLVCWIGLNVPFRRGLQTGCIRFYTIKQYFGLRLHNFTLSF